MVLGFPSINLFVSFALIRLPIKASLSFHTARDMASIVNPPRDPNTLSNYNNFKTIRTVANLEISFEERKISGSILLRLKSIADAASQEILLDTSHLNVRKVSLNKKTVKWDLLPRFEPYGSCLSIRLDEGIENGTCVEVGVSQRLKTVFLSGY